MTIKQKCVELSDELINEIDKLPQHEAQALAEWVAQHWQIMGGGAMAYARATDDGRKAVKKAMKERDKALKERGLK